jgi:hypothetical protein
LAPVQSALGVAVGFEVGQGRGCSNSRLGSKSIGVVRIVVLSNGREGERAERKCVWNTIPDAPSPREW